MGKLNPEFKAKWIAALRSGDYQQTQETLRDSKGFCCLGVACDVFDPDGWQLLTNATYNYMYDDGKVSEIFTALLRERMLRNIGMPDLAQYQLTVRNDRGDSFAAIANYIEENL